MYTVLSTPLTRLSLICTTLYKYSSVYRATFELKTEGITLGFFSPYFLPFIANIYILTYPAFTLALLVAALSQYSHH